MTLKWLLNGGGAGDTEAGSAERAEQRLRRYVRVAPLTPFLSPRGGRTNARSKEHAEWLVNWPGMRLVGYFTRTHLPPFFQGFGFDEEPAPYEIDAEYEIEYAAYREECQAYRASRQATAAFSYAAAASSGRRVIPPEPTEPIRPPATTQASRLEQFGQYVQRHEGAPVIHEGLRRNDDDDDDDDDDVAAAAGDDELERHYYFVEARFDHIFVVAQFVAPGFYNRMIFVSPDEPGQPGQPVHLFAIAYFSWLNQDEYSDFLNLLERVHGAIFSGYQGNRQTRLSYEGQGGVPPSWPPEHEIFLWMMDELNYCEFFLLWMIKLSRYKPLLLGFAEVQPQE